MKILQISTNWGHGGPGGVVKDIHNQLTAEGHEMMVAYGRYDVPDNIPAVQIGSKLDVYAHVLWTRVFDASGFGSYFATKRLIQDIKRIKPDLVHLHNLLGYYLNIEVLFKYLKKTNMPVVWTLHDCWAFTGHCINFERTGCTKWETGCHHCQLRDNYPESLAIDRSAVNYKKKKRAFTGVPGMVLVTPSQWLANLVSKSYLKDYPCSVIHNGIDLNVFKPVDSDVRERYGLQGKKLLLFVASVWNEMKGEHIAYQLAEKLDESYAMVMIGRKSATDVPGRIINLQRTQNVEELVNWYTAADVFVNPTLGDNFPTVNLEAMACGTPVVTFDTGGSKESVGTCGEVAPHGDVQALLEAIHRCTARAITRQDCLERAQLYDKKRCFGQYVAVYDEALKK